MEDGGDLLNLILLAVCLVLSAFFSGSEAAFLSLQRVRLMHLVRIGKAGSARVARMIERPDRLLSTVLLSNNLVNTAAAALGSAVAISFLNDVARGVLASTIGVTVLLLVFSETIPKTLATRHAERITFSTVRIIEALEILFFPFTRSLQRLSQVVARLSGGQTVSRVTEEEIRTLIYAGKEEGAVETVEAEMLEKVFHFGDRAVREVMTPRTELVSVERGTTLSKFLDTYGQHSHTRFPVYEGSVDNVTGILSVKDVVRALAEGELKAEDSVTKLLRPAHFVPETKSVAQLFSELRSGGQQIAIVVDEYGGVAGLVTIKRLLEIIVGPVGEEGEPLEEEFQVIDENTYELDGGISIQEANEKLDLGLPEGEYQTVAGFLLERLGHIPQEGEHLLYGDLRFRIDKMSGVRIEAVEVRRAVRQEEDQ